MQPPVPSLRLVDVHSQGRSPRPPPRHTGVKTMPRYTTLAGTAAAAAVALSGLAMPAHAEAVVYESRNVRSNPPDAAGHEYASLDIPTGYARDRLNWHTV